MQVQKIFRDRRGSNLVESALVFGAFIFMVIGAFDFGQAVFMHQGMVERVRAAARYASMTPSATDDRHPKPGRVWTDNSSGQSIRSRFVLHKCGSQH